MIYRIIPSILLFILVVFNKPAKGLDKQRTFPYKDSIVHINNTKFILYKSFKFDEIKFTFRTEYSKIDVSDSEADLRNPPRLSQLLTIYLKNNVKRNIYIPKNLRYHKTKNGDRIKIVDIRIDEIKFFEYKGQKCFKISGYGGCFSCNEFEGFYFMNGEIIYSSYKNKHKTIQNIDNLNNIWRNTLSDSEFLKNPISKIYLDTVASVE